MTSEEKLNSITRLVILLTLLGYLITKTFKIVVTGIVTLAAIVILFSIQNMNASFNLYENFSHNKWFFDKLSRLFPNAG